MNNHLYIFETETLRSMLIDAARVHAAAVRRGETELATASGMVCDAINAELCPREEMLAQARSEYGPVGEGEREERINDAWANRMYRD